MKCSIQPMYGANVIVINYLVSHNIALPYSNAGQGRGWLDVWNPFSFFVKYKEMCKTKCMTTVVLTYPMFPTPIKCGPINFLLTNYQRVFTEGLLKKQSSLTSFQVVLSRNYTPCMPSAGPNESNLRWGP